MNEDRTTIIFNFLKKYHQRWGFAPTFREIGQGCNISTSSLVRYHLDKLERQGKIRRKGGIARGIVINE